MHGESVENINVNKSIGFHECVVEQMTIPTYSSFLSCPFKTGEKILAYLKNITI